MQKISADIVFPQNSKPITKGILITEDDGTIVDVIDPLKIDYSIEGVNMLQGLLCPGFVNAHCHLELSYMQNVIPQKTGIADFIDRVEGLKKSTTHEEKLYAIEQAINAVKLSGTVAVGDIVNTVDTFEFKKQSNLYFHNFIEVYGSNANIAEQQFKEVISLENIYKEIGSTTIVPHAPYSVSPQLFNRIKNHLKNNSSPVCIHHAESKNEIEFFQKGTGAIAEMLNRLGTDISQFAQFNRTSFDYLNENLLPLNSPLQLVHNTYLNSNFINTLTHHPISELYFCICPNSNLFIENILPDINLFVKANLAITIGTDSLASNKELSILEEIKTIKTHFPEISLERILQWATLNGARFLGIDKQFGSFEKGKKPGIINFNQTSFQLQ